MQRQRYLVIYLFIINKTRVNLQKFPVNNFRTIINRTFSFNKLFFFPTTYERNGIFPQNFYILVSGLKNNE